MDCETFDIIGPWEADHGSQQLGYDFWWHMNQNIAVSSEWAKPPLFENGLQLDALLRHEYGHQLHFWDLKTHKHLQAVDLGENHQMVLELRPAHEPTRFYGFAGVVIDTTNLASSIWLWHKPNGKFEAKKVIEIPAEPTDADRLPPALKQFGAVPPLVSDIDLSMDDRHLYVSCWGLGELRQYDVSDPFAPKLTGTVRIGGIGRHTPHPSGRPAQGGPQMVEISRDNKRVYFTNSLYSPWDPIFYPEGMAGWMACAKLSPDSGFALDTKLFVEFEDGYRAHQVRLEGGDCSTESFCFPSS
jgi:selenium-binding protein 1